MTTIDIFLIGAGLAMDAAAVSMTDGMVYRNLGKSTYAAMILLFGFFQFLMPVIGYFAGGALAGLAAGYSGLVIFTILAIIGGKMIKEGISDRKEDGCCCNKVMSVKILLLQAIATSIDAFAVGLGFRAAGMEVWMPAAAIGMITVCIVAIAVLIGRSFGDMLGCRAEILGGIILVMTGVKALI